jgi:hypothetical protein
MEFVVIDKAVPRDDDFVARDTNAEVNHYGPGGIGSEPLSFRLYSRVQAKVEGSKLKFSCLEQTRSLMILLVLQNIICRASALGKQHSQRIPSKNSCKNSNQGSIP